MLFRSNPTYTDAVRVCVQNSSNRAYRMGVGKTFPSFDAAAAAYKLADVRAIIRAAAAGTRLALQLLSVRFVNYPHYTFQQS